MWRGCASCPDGSWQPPLSVSLCVSVLSWGQGAATGLVVVVRPWVREGSGRISRDPAEQRRSFCVSAIMKQLHTECGPGDLAWAARLLARLPVPPTESKQKTKDGVVVHFSLPMCLFWKRVGPAVMQQPGPMRPSKRARSWLPNACSYLHNPQDSTGKEGGLREGQSHGRMEFKL